jgi:hypothetical protein
MMNYRLNIFFINNPDPNPDPDTKLKINVFYGLGVTT